MWVKSLILRVMKTAVVQTTKPTLKPLNFFINVLVSYLVAMSLKQLDWIVALILQPSTTSSTIDLQTKKLHESRVSTNGRLRSHGEKPPAFKTFNVPHRHATLMIFKLVHAMSSCVQTNSAR